MKSLLLTATLCLFGFATAQAGAINQNCPVSSKPAKEGKSVDVPVTFCCGNCKEKFDKAPAEYLKKVSSAEDGKCPVSGKDAKPANTSTITVGVCCGNCEKKVKENPKSYLGLIEVK